VETFPVKRCLDDSYIHELNKFRDFVKGNKHYQKPVLERIPRSQLHNQLRIFIEKYVADNEKQKVLTFAHELIVTIPAYKNQNYLFYKHFEDRLYNEASLWTYQITGTSSMGVPEFREWFQTCLDKQLKTYPAFVLLACYWERATQKYISPFRIGKLTGFDLDSIETHIKDFEKNGLIPPNPQEPEPHDEAVKIIPIPESSWQGYLPALEEAYFAQENLLKGYNFIKYLGYTVSEHVPDTNPFVQRTGDLSIYMSQHFASMQLLATAVLSEEILLEWIKASYRSKPKDVLKRLRATVSEFLEKTIHPASVNHAHYDGIAEVFPLLHYIGKRRFYIDYDGNYYRSIGVIKDTAALIRGRFFSALQDVEVFVSGYPKWDKNYFSKCLTDKDPSALWHEKYPDVNIDFFQISGTRSGNNTEINIKYSEPITLVAGSWDIDDLRALPMNFCGVKEIHEIIKLGLTVDKLTKTKTDIHQGGSPYHIFRPDIFNSITHRIHMNQPTSQGKSRYEKMLYKAKAGYQFLVVDISATELEILKGYIYKYGFADKGSLNNLTFETVAIQSGLSRGKIKDFFYPFIYGGGDKLIIKEKGLTRDELDKIYAALEKFPQIQSYKDHIKTKTKKAGYSPPTPLGYSAPVEWLKAKNGLSYQIQGTGAEIMREWILEIHKAKLSVYLVNVIHDEMILELPQSLSLEQTLSKVTRALDVATTKLLPEANLIVHAYASRSWDKNSGVVICLPKP
jgi:hypothetical protein